MTVLDTVFKELDIRDYKYYPLSTLNFITNELGITRLSRASFNADFISRKVNRGILVLPPKPACAHHKLTGVQMKQIVRAFSPGGSGKWVWKDDIDTGENDPQADTTSKSEGTGEQDNGSSQRAVSE